MTNVPEWLPENIRWLMYEAGIPWSDGSGHEEPDKMQELLDIGRSGHCMTCGSRLGEDTFILFGNGGIQGVYHKGVCLTDQLLIGWLQGQLDDTISAIQNRMVGAEGVEMGDLPGEEDSGS